MKMHPIISAIRRQFAGPLLIACQISLTLAIVCNALFIIGERIARIDRPTGLQEDGLYWVTQQWTRPLGETASTRSAQLDAMQVEDMAALRKIPGVISVSAVSTLPLLNSSRDGAISLEPDHPGALTRTVYYYGDENMLTTLGVHLVEGRSFVASEIAHEPSHAHHSPPVIIVTQALARTIFGNSSALGKSIYLDGSSSPSRIVGVIDRLQVSTTNSWADTFNYHSILVPIRLSDDTSTYAVRTRPDALDAAMKATAASLYGLNPFRVIAEDGIRSYSQIRNDAYRSDIGMAILMASISVIFLAVTAAGIVGLTSFWVSQRRRQIGIRRALGARRRDIFRDFQLENAIISGAGVFLGMILAFALNVWLTTHYELSRLPVIYVVIGAVLVWGLGQLAVFVPARRAANIEPMAAILNRTN